MLRIIYTLISCLFVVCSTWSKAIPFTFNMNGTICQGNVLCPDEKDSKVIFIYVNHKLIESEVNFQFYQELTQKLLNAGISCCYYDNRPTLLQDTTSHVTLFEMAADAAEVYRVLKTDKQFKKYKIGFYGGSEAGSSALLAASMVNEPAFLIQQSSVVMPQIEKDFLNITIIPNAFLSAFVNPNIAGLPFYDFASLIKEVSESLQDKQINNIDTYIKRMFDKYFSHIDEQKRQTINQLLSITINKMASELGVAERLIWNAKPYYKNVRCPILYIGALNDTNVPCFPNLTEFERIMFENNQKQFNTIVLDVDHQMRTSQEVREQHYHQTKPEGVKKPIIWDAIVRWLKKYY